MSDTTADTINKYNDYVITSFVKAIEPVVVAHASGATITDADGIEYSTASRASPWPTPGIATPK